MAAEAPGSLDALKEQKRVGRLGNQMKFWAATERWPMLQAIYPEAGVGPVLLSSESDSTRQWQREEAVRELVRGRMEIIGPITAGGLANFGLLGIRRRRKTDKKS